MKPTPNAVPAILPDDRKSPCFCTGLNCCTDIAKPRARSNCCDPKVEALFCGFDESLRQYRRLSSHKHPACVTVKAFFNHGDIDINDVATLEALISRNAVADHVIDTSTD